MHALAFVFLAWMSVLPQTPALRATPVSDWFLLAYVDNSAPIITKSGYTAALMFTYGGVVALRHDEVRALFPPTYGDGTPAEWGVRSVDGLHVTLALPHTFDSAELYPNPEVIEPAAILDLAQGGSPIALTEVRYREDDTQPYQIDHGCSPGGGPCTSYDHGRIALFDLDSIPVPSPWTATVTVELYCVYKDATGLTTGVLTGADVGLPTASDTVTMEYLPVPAAPVSWGTLKSQFGAE